MLRDDRLTGSPIGNRLLRGIIMFLLAAALGERAFGQVTVTPTSDDTFPFVVSSTDLLQTNLASAAITGGPGFSFFGTGLLSTLIDGNFGATGTDFGTVVSFQPATDLTFSFDLTASPAGYDLSQIQTYTGWDTGRDGQEYSLAYSTASAPGTFIPLASVGPFNVASSTGNGNLRVTISDLLGGTLVSHVATLRFTFTGFENNASAWREFDVIGTPTAVPEPSTAAMATLGLLLLASVAVKRRRQNTRRNRATAQALPEKL